MDDGEENKEVSYDASNVQDYLNALENLFNRDCEDLLQYYVGPTPYQTNINTQRSWILGGISLNDLVREYMYRARTYDNLTNCGINTPFFDGFDCITC